jgi:hypothetical protein
MEKTEDLLVKVNYQKSLKQAIGAVGYEKINKNVENFKKQTPDGLLKDKEIIKVALFNFSHTIFYDYGQIISVMNKEGYRPATFMELLAFCTQFETSKSILALGSIHNDHDGPYAPCSGRGDNELMYFYVGSSQAMYSPWYFMGVKLA